MAEYSEFGLKARKVMLEKDIKQIALAKDLGISPYYLSEILKGTRPGKKYRRAICEKLGIEEISK